MNDRFHARDRAIKACPHVDRPQHRAYIATQDAMELVTAVRDLDPREVWGTLRLWGEKDPLRLFGVITALAAMVPPGRTAGELLAWTERFVPGEAREVA